MSYCSRLYRQHHRAQVPWLGRQLGGSKETCSKKGTEQAQGEPNLLGQIEALRATQKSLKAEKKNWRRR